LVEADDWTLKFYRGGAWLDRGELPDFVWLSFENGSHDPRVAKWFFCKEDAELFYSWNDEEYTKPVAYSSVFGI
jgi:hypothetical protein